jgi:hypothetical protein
LPTRSFVVTLKKKQGYFLIAFWVVYVFVAALLSLSRRGPLPTVFAFEFGFGDLVGSLLQRQVYASSDGLLTGHRMPMIPYFLAAISLISTNGLFVNDLFVSLLDKPSNGIVERKSQVKRFPFWCKIVLESLLHRTILCT